MKDKFLDFARLVKFEHTIFAMPFALIGFFLAASQTEQVHYFRLLVDVVAAMIFARNAAMGFNRYLDRKFDAANPRTANREIPAGIIAPGRALVFVIFNSLLFVFVAWLINDLCFYLSPVALFVILGYSYTKRITPLCHFVLSTGLALAPIGAWLAVTGKFALVPLLFSAIVFFWVSGFDIIYASQDIDFDRKYKLQSIPAMVGVKNALLISSVLHFITIAFVILAGLAMKAGMIFWIGAAIFIALIIYQHAIVKHDDLSRVNLAFGTTNGIASIIFATFVIVSLYF
jgi:4-hydroxybenzoate polyprenyltransferase